MGPPSHARSRCGRRLTPDAYAGDATTEGFSCCSGRYLGYPSHRRGQIRRRSLDDVTARIRACSGICFESFKKKTGIDVKVLAQGTGRALDTARRGEGDVVFVHSKAAEEKFVSEGFGSSAVR
jgi:hypothetical protein